MSAPRLIAPIFTNVFDEFLAIPYVHTQADLESVTSALKVACSNWADKQGDALLGLDQNTRLSAEERMTLIRKYRLFIKRFAPDKHNFLFCNDDELNYRGERRPMTESQKSICESLAYLMKYINAGIEELKNQPLESAPQKPNTNNKMMTDDKNSNQSQSPSFSGTSFKQGESYTNTILGEAWKVFLEIPAHQRAKIADFINSHQAIINDLIRTRAGSEQDIVTSNVLLLAAESGRKEHVKQLLVSGAHIPTLPPEFTGAASVYSKKVLETIREAILAMSPSELEKYARLPSTLDQLIEYTELLGTRTLLGAIIRHISKKDHVSLLTHLFMQHMYELFFTVLGNDKGIGQAFHSSFANTQGMSPLIYLCSTTAHSEVNKGLRLDAIKVLLRNTKTASQVMLESKYKTAFRAAAFTNNAEALLHLMRHGIYEDETRNHFKKDHVTKCGCTSDRGHDQIANAFKIIFKDHPYLEVFLKVKAFIEAQIKIPRLYNEVDEEELQKHWLRVYNKSISYCQDNKSCLATALEMSALLKHMAKNSTITNNQVYCFLVAHGVMSEDHKPIDMASEDARDYLATQTEGACLFHFTEERTLAVSTRQQTVVLKPGSQLQESILSLELLSEVKPSEEVILKYKDKVNNISAPTSASSSTTDSTKEKARTSSFSFWANTRESAQVLNKLMMDYKRKLNSGYDIGRLNLQILEGDNLQESSLNLKIADATTLACAYYKNMPSLISQISSQGIRPDQFCGVIAILTEARELIIQYFAHAHATEIYDFSPFLGYCSTETVNLVRAYQDNRRTFEECFTNLDFNKPVPPMATAQATKTM